MNNQKGVVHPFIFLFLLAIAGAIYFLVTSGLIKLPTVIKLPGVVKDPEVSLQTQYQNPFGESAQYVNPFDSYKNPFDKLK